VFLPRQKTCTLDPTKSRDSRGIALCPALSESESRMLRAEGVWKRSALPYWPTAIHGKSALKNAAPRFPGRQAD
jgi:hypothetical protein